MKENVLLKAALISSLLGILVLFFVSRNIKVEEKTIQELANVENEQELRIKGVVEQVKDLGNIMIINLVQPESVSVMLFKEGNISIKRGDFIDLEGLLREYKGEKEIIANQIKIIE